MCCFEEHATLQHWKKTLRDIVMDSTADLASDILIALEEGCVEMGLPAKTPVFAKKEHYHGAWGPEVAVGCVELIQNSDGSPLLAQLYKVKVELSVKYLYRALKLKKAQTGTARGTDEAGGGGEGEDAVALEEKPRSEARNKVLGQYFVHMVGRDARVRPDATLGAPAERGASRFAFRRFLMKRGAATETGRSWDHHILERPLKLDHCSVRASSTDWTHKLLVPSARQYYGHTDCGTPSPLRARDVAAVLRKLKKSNEVRTRRVASRLLEEGFMVTCTLHCNENDPHPHVTLQSPLLSAGQAHLHAVVGGLRRSGDVTVEWTSRFGQVAQQVLGHARGHLSVTLQLVQRARDPTAFSKKTHSPKPFRPSVRTRSSSPPSRRSRSLSPTPRARTPNSFEQRQQEAHMATLVKLLRRGSSPSPPRSRHETPRAASAPRLRPPHVKKAATTDHFPTLSTSSPKRSIPPAPSRKCRVPTPKRPSFASVLTSTPIMRRMHPSVPKHSHPEQPIPSSATHQQKRTGASPGSYLIPFLAPPVEVSLLPPPLPWAQHFVLAEPRTISVRFPPPLRIQARPHLRSVLLSERIPPLLRASSTVMHDRLARYLAPSSGGDPDREK